MFRNAASVTSWLPGFTNSLLSFVSSRGRSGLSAQIRFFAVNRKQRRIAAKLGKQAIPSAAPGATVGPSVRIAELLAAAQQLKQQGKLDEAVARYRWALALEPDNADVHYSLGNAFILQSKLDAAAAHYHRAIVLKPNFAEAHNNFGNVLRRQSKLDEAAAHISGR